jgi:hypothetical protein
MKTRLLLLASCLFAFAAQAQDSKVQMWMWKDANGVVHYSDVPGPGAVRVGVSVSKGQPGTAPAVPGSDAGQGEGRGEGRGEGARPAAATAYTSLEIVQPANGASFFEADAVVDVQIASDPALQDGDSVHLYLDGERVGSSGDAMGYSLSSLERGEHTLSAAIVDSQGTEKIRSQSVVFYMKQQTIYDSKGRVDTPDVVGPKLKPPPKPPPKPTPKGG